MALLGKIGETLGFGAGGTFGPDEQKSQPITGAQIYDVFKSLAPIFGNVFTTDANGNLQIDPNFLAGKSGGTLQPQTITPSTAGTPTIQQSNIAAAPQTTATTATAPTAAATTVQGPQAAATPQIANVSPMVAPNIAQLPGINFDPQLLNGGDFAALREALYNPTARLLDTEQKRAIDTTQESLAQRGIFASPVSLESERRVNEQYSQARQNAQDVATSAATQLQSTQNNVLNQILGTLAGTEFTGGVNQNIAQLGAETTAGTANLAAQTQAAIAQGDISKAINLGNLDAALQTSLKQGDVDSAKAINDALVAADIAKANQSTALEASKANTVAGVEQNIAQLGANTQTNIAQGNLAGDVGKFNATQSQTAKTYNADNILGAQKFNILQKLGMDETTFNRFAQLFGILFSPAGAQGTGTQQGAGLGYSLLNAAAKGAGAAAGAAGG